MHRVVEQRPIKDQEQRDGPGFSARISVPDGNTHGYDDTQIADEVAQPHVAGDNVVPAYDNSHNPGEGKANREDQPQPGHTLAVGYHYIRRNLSLHIPSHSS